MDKLIVIHQTGGGLNDGDYRSDDPEHAEWVKEVLKTITMPETLGMSQGSNNLFKLWKESSEQLGETAHHHYRYKERKDTETEIHIYRVYVEATPKLPV